MDGRMWTRVDCRFYVDETVFMFDPVASDFFEGDQSTCRQDLSIHRIIIEFRK